MVMKKNVKRENLKNNFLNNIIVRFDYVGVAESELDSIIASIKLIFRANGYDKFKEENLTELDFQFEDPENIDEINGLPVKEIRKKKAYVFFDEERGIKCKVSTQFAFVSVQSQNYIPFSEYSKTLIDVMKMLESKVDFLDFTRFGIRKINKCIISDVEQLYQYFEKEFLPIYGLEHGVVPKLLECKNCFTEENFNINYMGTLVEGEYKAKRAYQVILDFDIYLAESDYIKGIFSENGNKNIEEMNERLFELYKETLTNEFIKKLEEENFVDQNIIGVEKNEGIYYKD